jgi:DNA polymerase-3 subunit beta
MPTQVLVALAGAQFVEKTDRVLVIGLASGITAGAVTLLPDLGRLEVAELEPAVVRAAELFGPYNHDLLNHEKVEVIIPSRALREVERLIGDDTDPIQLSINAQRSQIMFKMANAEIVATLIQGTFPNYSQLIPQSYNTRTEISIKDFRQETRIASIFARDGAGIVRLQVDPSDGGPGKMTVSARAEEIGEHRGEIDVKVEGEASKIAFNSKYLQDVLEVGAGVEQVQLETTSPSSPGVIRAVGDERYVHVVMPMFVQW